MRRGGEDLQGRGGELEDRLPAHLCRGGEFHRALAAFSARYPDGSVSIAYGSHGELCDMLSEDRVEITLNDQRRLFPTPTKI